MFAGLLSNPLLAACEATTYDETARLDKVYDGDTIRLTDGRKVRIIAVNTPEMAYKERPSQPLAEEASQALNQLFQASKLVYLKYGKDRRDRYNRYLAHVFTDQGKNVAAELIRAGHGFAILVPPNDWKYDCYFKQDRQASNEKRGVWAQPHYQPRQATDLDRKMTGFQLVEGGVDRIGQAKKSLWLDLAPLFSVKLQRHNLKYFENQPIESLIGKRIRVRGWASYYYGKLRMTVGHPAMMEILE